MGRVLGGTRRDQTESGAQSRQPGCSGNLGLWRRGWQRLGLLNWWTHIKVPKESWQRKKNWGMLQHKCSTPAAGRLNQIAGLSPTRKGLVFRDQAEWSPEDTLMSKAGPLCGKGEFCCCSKQGDQPAVVPSNTLLFAILLLRGGWRRPTVFTGALIVYLSSPAVSQACCANRLLARTFCLIFFSARRNGAVPHRSTRSAPCKH